MKSNNEICSGIGWVLFIYGCVFGMAFGIIGIIIAIDQAYYYNDWKISTNYINQTAFEVDRLQQGYIIKERIVQDTTGFNKLNPTTLNNLPRYEFTLYMYGFIDPEGVLHVLHRPTQITEKLSAGVYKDIFTKNVYIV